MYFDAKLYLEKDKCNAWVINFANDSHISRANRNTFVHATHVYIVIRIIGRNVN
jgi:hypothetical protein